MSDIAMMMTPHRFSGLFRYVTGAGAEATVVTLIWNVGDNPGCMIGSVVLVVMFHMPVPDLMCISFRLGRPLFMLALRDLATSYLAFLVFG
jgi:uncharacterized paraquat-inducible protein A